MLTFLQKQLDSVVMKYEMPKKKEALCDPNGHLMLLFALDMFPDLVAE
jgi:hypothetical protein